jgi:FKBP-type peptidyl-prolyl cis-trans isomerase FkpA
MMFASVGLLMLMAQSPTPKATPTPKSTAALKTAVTPKTTPKTSVKTATRPAVAKPDPKSAAATMTDEEKTVYALGLSIYRSIQSFDLTPAEIEVIQRALRDASLQQPAVELSEWGPKLNVLQQERQSRRAEKERSLGAEFIAKAATELGALKTDSGLVYRELTPGAGAAPTAGDTVKVHYRGTLINGTEFDSSYKRGQPAEFPLNQVIPCWTEGVQKMKVGGKGRLVCPANLAYGDRGSGSIPGGATLIFEIELIDITTGK